MSIIFGPVASRRFGSSLGIDLSPKEKCCNFDCLYCELKAAKARNNIIFAPSVSEVITELKAAILNFGATDVITITANGEPSLYPNLRELISKINEIKSTQKLLILSNGSPALDKNKLEDLKELDIVKFSLDSVNKTTFRKIDRSLEQIDLEKLVENMSEFRANFKGELVMEVLVLEGLNDNKDEFSALNLAFAKIKPARIDISTLDRPAAHKSAKAISEQKLKELASFIDCAPVFVASRKSFGEIKNLNKDEILKLILLRPQSKDDIEYSFSSSSKQNLNELLKENKIIKQNFAGAIFYMAV